MRKLTRNRRRSGAAIAALLLLVWLCAPLAPGAAQATSGNTYYLSPAGNDNNPGSAAQPWRTVDKAARTIQPGDTVIVNAGVYRVASIAFGPAGISFDRMVTYKAAPGARAIFTTASDTPPPVSVGSFVRVEGLWFGGRWKTGSVSFSTGGSPISRGVQLVGNTLFGYTELSQGSAEYALYQGNRFVLTGTGRFQHGIYLSGGHTAGSIAQHAIVDNNLFIGGEGYAIHNWHDTHSNIITRNFVTGHYWGLVQDGEDHLIANNFFWKMTGQPGAEGPWGAWIAGGRIQFINNILGPNGHAWGNTANNTIRKNAFLNAQPFGSSTITLTPGQEQAQLGVSAQQLDGAIAALKQAFGQPVDAIYANTAIEGHFATLRFTIPAGSPLYQAGQSWIPGVASMNIGPDAPSPATLDEFWAAFCALGLRHWDSSGNLVQ